MNKNSRVHHIFSDVTMHNSISEWSKNI